MSRYPAYTPQGIDIREAGPGESGKVVETITADDLLALKRLVSQPTRAGSIEPRGVLTPVVKSAAATPEPGLDVDAELERLRGFHQSAINEDPRIPKSTFSHFNATFRAGFRVYLRDLESRCKPAEPSGWPEVTEDDVRSIHARIGEINNATASPCWRSFGQALQEWLGSKPRPKPVVNSNGTPVADVNSWGPSADRPEVNIPSGFTGTINDVDPFMTLTRNPPESVELTERQVFDLVLAYNGTDTLTSVTVAVNAALRKMGLGLHRLDPKPTAEPDPGEDWATDADLLERLFVDFGFFRADMTKAKAKLDSIAEMVAVVPIMDRRLDAIAERLDGPKVEAVPITASLAAELTPVFTPMTFIRSDIIAANLGDLMAKLGLILIRKPLTKGDPS